MDIENLRRIIAERIRISVETNDEWDQGIENCWNEEVNILTKDPSETIKYLQDDCTAEEFGWLSEIFDDIIEKTRSYEILNQLKALACKYPEECEKSNIEYCISYAESLLEEDP